MTKALLLVFLFGISLGATGNMNPDLFVVPTDPIIEKDFAPSDKVTSGVLFETARMDWNEKELVIPETAVVEVYEEDRVQFFVTKKMRCSGHPPQSMKIADARSHFGVAFQENEVQIRCATFGEWQNKGGVAQVKLLILVPQQTVIRKQDGLSGINSPARKKRDLSDKALEKCYWYSGIGPADGWTPVKTDLFRNRFLNPDAK